MKPRMESLPGTITAPRTDPIYNCHGYLTKVPIGAIEPFIETFTQKGEVIADFFAGSGMTGLAAVRLGCKARLSDISALGRHIARGYATSVSPERFHHTAQVVVAEARKAIGNLYATRRASDGAVVEMVRTVWSFTYVALPASPLLSITGTFPRKTHLPKPARPVRHRSCAVTGAAAPTCPSRSSREPPKGGWLISRWVISTST